MKLYFVVHLILLPFFFFS